MSWRDDPDRRCPGSNRQHDFGSDGKYARRRGPCPVCGRDVSNHPAGYISQHVRPDRLGEAELPSTDECVRLVARLLGGAIRPEVFWLHDGSFEARLTVDPEVAFAALRVQRGA